jgi:hypothetical protein
MMQQPDVQNSSLYVSVVWMRKLQDLPLKWKLFWSLRGGGGQKSRQTINTNFSKEQKQNEKQVIGPISFNLALLEKKN